MVPMIKEFQDDTELMQEVKIHSASGVKKEKLYVMSHDDDRTERVADNVEANTVGVNEEGLNAAVSNIFRKKGDALRVKLKELGFNQTEANELEEKLDHGKILLIVDKE